MGILKKIFIRAGFGKYSTDTLIKDIKTDMLNGNQNLRNKIWAYKRGFMSSSIALYGLTERNYQNYVPDIGYYRMKLLGSHRKFRIWFDNKMTMYYVLQPFKEYLPRYYFMKMRDELIAFNDTERSLLSQNGNDANALTEVINKIKSVNMVALKPISGSRGNGFRKIRYAGANTFFANDIKVDENVLLGILSRSHNHIISEYIENHEFIKNIYQESLNTVRIMLIRDIKDQSAKIVGACMRFGSRESGVVDNFAAGGILCGVDINDGLIFGGKRKQGGTVEDCEYHPDTGKKIDGFLPYWNLIKNELPRICDHFPQLKMFGADVAITPNGFKIIEVNMYPRIRNFQIFFPLLKNDPAKSFFKRYLR